MSRTLSVLIRHAWKMSFEVVGVEGEFWRDVRKAENSGGTSIVEYGMKISWP